MSLENLLWQRFIMKAATFAELFQKSDPPPDLTDLAAGQLSEATGIDPRHMHSQAGTLLKPVKVNGVDFSAGDAMYVAPLGDGYAAALGTDRKASAPVIALAPPPIVVNDTAADMRAAAARITASVPAEVAAPVAAEPVPLVWELPAPSTTDEARALAAKLIARADELDAQAAAKNQAPLPLETPATVVTP